MEQHPDICIIGGGVIGLTTAYYLARDGVRVGVVDKGEFGREASWAGAGILPPGQSTHARSPVDQLRAHSAVLFPSLSAELRERTGVDNGYTRCGGLEFVPEGAAPVEQEWLGEGIDFETLEAEALHRLEPALAADLTRAYYMPDMGQLRNPRHVKALLGACAALGVRLQPGCSVHGFERQGKHITALRTGTGLLRADRFVLATGAWSDALLDLVGWRPGIHPVRGQIALLNAGVALFRRILLQGTRYLVPRPDGRILIGSTEEEVGFDKRNTAEAIRALLELACTLVPALAACHLERCWAGLRPGSPDGLPYLGAVPGVDNLFIAAGHFRAGILLSPATGLVMKELLLGQKLTVPLEPFRLDRMPVPPSRGALRS